MKRVALELGRQEPQHRVRGRRPRRPRSTYALTAVFLTPGRCARPARGWSSRTPSTTQFVDELVRRARRIRLGGPFDEDAETGPLISAAHRDKVEAYVAAGLAEGAVLRVRRRPARGCGATTTGSTTCRPILDECAADMSCVQDGVLRAGADRRDVHRRGPRRARGGGGLDRQRHDLRAGRRGVDRERRPRRAGRRPPAARHGLDQRLPPVRPAGRVGRLQAERGRPRARPGRARGVPRDQAHLAQHAARPRPAGSADRRDEEGS